MRDLANAKLQDGDSTVSARYARERKHSALELLEKARHKARDIFDRQVCPQVVTFSVLLQGCSQRVCIIGMFQIGISGVMHNSEGDRAGSFSHRESVGRG